MTATLLVLDYLFSGACASLPEITVIAEGLEIEELQFLWCLRKHFPGSTGFYRFAMKESIEKERLRAMGTSLGRNMTSEEFCKLWNGLIVSWPGFHSNDSLLTFPKNKIRGKVRFLAAVDIVKQDSVSLTRPVSTSEVVMS